MTRPTLLSEPAAHAPPPNSTVPVLDVVVPVHNEERELEASVRRPSCPVCGWCIWVSRAAVVPCGTTPTS